MSRSFCPLRDAKKGPCSKQRRLGSPRRPPLRFCVSRSSASDALSVPLGFFSFSFLECGWVARSVPFSLPPSLSFFWCWLRCRVRSPLCPECSPPLNVPPFQLRSGFQCCSLFLGTRFQFFFIWFLMFISSFLECLFFRQVVLLFFIFIFRREGGSVFLLLVSPCKQSCRCCSCVVGLAPLSCGTSF